MKGAGSCYFGVVKGAFSRSGGILSCISTMSGAQNQTVPPGRSTDGEPLTKKLLKTNKVCKSIIP